MKRICYPSMSYYQICTKHLILLLFLVILQVYSGCCDVQSRKSGEGYVGLFYNVNTTLKSNGKPKEICFGPFPNVSSMGLCEFTGENCNGMNTSCFKTACNSLARILKNEKTDSSQQQRFQEKKIVAGYIQLDKDSISNLTRNVRQCFNDSQIQTQFITNFTNTFANLSNFNTSSEVTIFGSTGAIKPKHNSTPQPSILHSDDKEKLLSATKSALIPQNDSTYWKSLLAMVAIITALASIAILVLLFHKVKLIKNSKQVDHSQENRDSDVHDYEEIATFPQRPTPVNFYHHNPIHVSCDDESLQSVSYSGLQTDQTLSSNNGLQQKMNYAVILPHK